MSLNLYDPILLCKRIIVTVKAYLQTDTTALYQLL